MSINSECGTTNLFRVLAYQIMSTNCCNNSLISFMEYINKHIAAAIIGIKVFYCKKNLCHMRQAIRNRAHSRET